MAEETPPMCSPMRTPGHRPTPADDPLNAGTVSYKDHIAVAGIPASYGTFALEGLTPNRRPSNWKPTGRHIADSPHGTLSAGWPVVLAWNVWWTMAVIGVPSAPSARGAASLSNGAVR